MDERVAIGVSREVEEHVRYDVERATTDDIRAVLEQWLKTFTYQAAIPACDGMYSIFPAPVLHKLKLLPKRKDMPKSELVKLFRRVEHYVVLADALTSIRVPDVTVVHVPPDKWLLFNPWFRASCQAREHKIRYIEAFRKLYQIP